MIIENQTHW